MLVVWEPVLRTDIAAPLTSVLGLLRDLRAQPYWDPGRIVSADFVRAFNEDPTRYGRDERFPPDFVAWDVVAVFEAPARWDRGVPAPAFYDGPVVGAIDAARTAIAAALSGARAASR